MSAPGASPGLGYVGAHGPVFRPAEPSDRHVAERLGVRLGNAGHGADPTVLLGLALRVNPRRTHLLVSTVLGKHVPSDPRTVHAVGLLLGGLVADVLEAREPRALPVDLLHAAARGSREAAVALHRRARTAADSAPDCLVLGFAETATALGHCVAEGLGGVDYLHSTRRAVRGHALASRFAEEHSHATEHLLLPDDPTLLRGGRPLVLVDDELSTGRTALNTITALHRTAPRDRYVVAALVDARSAEQAGELTAGVAALGARLDVVSLAHAEISVPADLPERAAVLREELGEGCTGPSPAGASDIPEPRVRLAAEGWPPGLEVGGRHGFTARDHRLLEASLPGLAAHVASSAGLVPGEPILVLATEELMYFPLRLAQTLADAGYDIAFSSTSRSPAVVARAPGYALTSGITFPAHDDPTDGPGPRYAYNLGRPGTTPPWRHVLVVVDPPADTVTLGGRSRGIGLLSAIAPLTGRATVVVTP